MFSKHNSQGDLVAGVVELPQQSESMEVKEQHHEVDIIASSIEYKRMSITKHACQCYADMIRVADDSVIDSLENGILCTTASSSDLWSDISCANSYCSHTQ